MFAPQRNNGNTSWEFTDIELVPIDILVDVIIEYLEKSTAYMRAVGNQAFSLLSGVVQESTVEFILAVRSSLTFQHVI
jgi:hypothetical protein